jgi:hypothetical protein
LRLVGQQHCTYLTLQRLAREILPKTAGNLGDSAARYTAISGGSARLGFPVAPWWFNGESGILLLSVAFDFRLPFLKNPRRN